MGLATVGSDRAFWFYTECRDSSIEAANPRVEVERVSDGYAVTVTADVLVRDLALLVDKVSPDAVVDDMLVTLLPGETHTFYVRLDAEVDASALASPRVVRTANQLVADWR